MAARINIDAAVMPPFKVGTDPRNDWTKWKRALDRYLQASKIVDDDEKFNLLLVLGGIDLQTYYDKIAKWEVLHTTDEGVVVLKYESAVLSLEKYFAPQLKKRFERHLLRSMRQDNQEPFEEYVFRLQDQASRCMFLDSDDMVVDQIIEGCKSPELRKKLLTDELQLNEVIAMGKTLEEVQKQTREYDRVLSNRDSNLEGPLVQKVVEHTGGKSAVRNKEFTNSRKCYNCNKPGHIARETDKCPARNVECHNCHTKGHYKICCRKRKHDEPGSSRQYGAKRVHAIIPEQAVSDKGIFFVKTSDDQSEVLRLDVGGVSTNMVIDSGSPANIVDNKTFELLKKHKANMLNERDPQQDGIRYAAFASKEDIVFSKVFETEIRIPGEETGVWSHVLVAPHGQVNLLSKGTAFALGVLKIGYHVNQISNNVAMDANVDQEEFPKVPGVLLTVQIDETVHPVAQPLRRFPVSMEADVEKTIQDLLAKKVIERVESPLTWVSPLVPVKKTDGKIRLCVDMRAANKAVKRENYPMPNIEDAMNGIRKVAKLSKIDLEAAYYHFELDPGCRNITTFVARSGMYRFCRLMFGIKSAPELFQREMENLFRGIKGLVAYMDDALIYGETEEEHDLALEEVLRRITGAKMKINEKKSVFGVKQVIFVGYEVSCKGIRPTEEKLKAINDLQPPGSVTELRSLLGLINFVGKFIPNLAALTYMRALLHKDISFVWTTEHTQELDNLKNILKRADTLAYFDPKDETLLVTDASPFGLGAILIQIKNGVSRTICCISKSLADNEKKFCQTEKECLAIVWALEKLYVYLYGLRFTLVTDCKPLEYLFNRIKTKSSARIERWILRLQSFDFVVRYEPGDQNLADALSRLTQEKANLVQSEPDVISWLAEEMRPTALTMEELESETRRDDELQKVKEAMYTGNWDEVPAEFKTTTIKNELTLYGELILRGDRIVIPKQLRDKVVQLAHLGHQGGNSMKALLRSRVWFPTMDKMVESILQTCKPCKMTALPDKPNPMNRRIPTEPWQDIAIDFKEGLPNEMSLLVVVCYTTRFIQIEPMKPATTQKVIGALLRMFSCFGIPRSITADNGPQFRATEFQNFCTSYGIHLNLSTPYWPEQNGAVERQMRNIGKRIKISMIQKTDWKTDLYEYITLYHSTPQETTGVSPGNMMFGRDIRSRIPSIHQPPILRWESAKDRDVSMKEQHKIRADEKRQAKYHELGEGDTVLMRNLKKGSLEPNFKSEEFTVSEVNGGRINVKSTETGKEYIRNSTHLKKLNPGRTSSTVEADRGQAENSSDNRRYPVRNTKRPAKFNDF